MGKLVNMKSPDMDKIALESAALGINTDASGYARWGWAIVVFGVCGSLVWAALAPLDQGVPVSGTVVVSGNRKAVQHLTGGTVSEILVKEGDVVKEGQVLLRLNDLRTKAESEISRIQYFTSRVVEARLLAERDGKAIIEFPKDLEAAKKDPRVEMNIALQTQLFASRKMAIQNELAAVEQSIGGLRSQNQGLTESRENKKMQKKILEDQIEGLKELVKDGFVPLGRLLDLERTLAQINGAIAEDTGNIGRGVRQIAELELRRAQRIQEVQRDVRTQLSDIQKEAGTLDERLKSQDFDRASTEVKAPASGTVVGLNVFTVGGVVSGGFKMMDIVPTNEELVVEGSIPVHLIDKIHSGLKVDFIFPAFNQNTTPHIPGIVANVAPDRLTDERTGQPYYRMKAKVTPKGVQLLAQHKILAGMSVEMFVKTGERTMMNYLFKPLMDRAGQALTEE